jgi:hypothetical protein
MRNQFLLCILFLAIISSTKAQMYIGGQLGTSYLIGLKPMISLGAHFNVVIKEEPIQFGINYHLPISYSGTDYLNPFSNQYDQKEITYTFKISAFDIHAMYRYYFNDAEMSDGGFYLLGGISVAIAREVITIPPYDKTIYYASDYLSNSPNLYPQFYINIGAGYDFVLSNDHILGGQLLLCLNGNTFNSQSGSSGDAALPSMIALKAHYSLPIGD